MSKSESPLVNRRQLGELLDVGPDKLRQLIADGVVPPPTIELGPRSDRWDWNEVIAHLQKRISDQTIARANERADAA